VYDQRGLSALNSECPNGTCGTCALTQTKRCFLNPIEATGLAGMDGSEVVSTFLRDSDGEHGVNNASGFPRRRRIVLDWDFTAYCPNGTTPFELGGSNCPP
jgi:hypothetical protein